MKDMINSVIEFLAAPSVYADEDYSVAYEYGDPKNTVRYIDKIGFFIGFIALVTVGLVFLKEKK